MAYRDREQPIAFIYTNLYKILQKAKLNSKNHVKTENKENISGVENKENISGVNDNLSHRENTVSSINENLSQKVGNLKDNLSKLVDMRKRLSIMLSILDKMGKK